MEPITWIVAGLIALTAYKCSDDSSGVDEPLPEHHDPVPPYVPIDSYADDTLDVVSQPDYVEVVPEVEVQTQPVDPAGYNSKFISGVECAISDVDVYERGETRTLYATLSLIHI